jgi:hypothetical protein
MADIPKRSLRAMRDRWQRDLDRLETAYPVDNWEADHPTLETIRNLATAIAQIEGMISAVRTTGGQ